MVILFVACMLISRFGRIVTWWDLLIGLEYSRSATKSGLEERARSSTERHSFFLYLVGSGVMNHLLKWGLIDRWIVGGVGSFMCGRIKSIVTSIGYHSFCNHIVGCCAGCSSIISGSNVVSGSSINVSQRIRIRGKLLLVCTLTGSMTSLATFKQAWSSYIRKMR